MHFKKPESQFVLLCSAASLRGSTVETSRIFSAEDGTTKLSEWVVPNWALFTTWPGTTSQKNCKPATT